MTKLIYSRFNDDLFMLHCRPDVRAELLDDVPVIARLDARLLETQQCDVERDGLPTGAVRNPKHWRGVFAIGKCLFRIPSVYASPKLFGLMCDTLAGDHDRRDIEQFVSEINE